MLDEEEDEWAEVPKLSIKTDALESFYTLLSVANVRLLGLNREHSALYKGAFGEICLE